MVHPEGESESGGVDGPEHSGSIDQLAVGTFFEMIDDDT